MLHRVPMIELLKYGMFHLHSIYSQHSSNVYVLEWLDNVTLASGSSDQTIKLWSMTKDQTVPKKKDGESLKGFFETIRPLTIVSYSVP
jgi:WD40 repeat protein